MFGNKKNRMVINSLSEMYEIFYEAISSAHMEGVYTGKKYNRMYETYSDNMLSVARVVSGEEGVFQLSMLCSQFHGENVEILNKECEEIEERALRDAEKEANNMEEKYDGYVTTMTKSPVYGNRWQPTLSEQPWQPAIGEAGWHAREGEMGSALRECLSESRLPHGGRLFGPESMYAGIDYEATDLEKKMAKEMLHGQTEKPAIKYIYHIMLVPLIDCPVDVLNERDKLINILRSKGFEAEEVYTDTLSVHSEKPITEFEELIGPIYRSTGIQCGYEIKYKGKLVPIVRYEEGN